LAEALAWAQASPVRGEFVILLAGNSGEDEVTPENQGSPLEQIKQLVAQGEKVNAAIKQVAKERGLNRQELYREYHEL